MISLIFTTTEMMKILDTMIIIRITTKSNRYQVPLGMLAKRMKSPMVGKKEYLRAALVHNEENSTYLMVVSIDSLKTAY